MSIRTILILISAIIAISITGCDKGRVKPEGMTISELKTAKVDKYIGKELSLVGYYVDRPVAMLVSDMKWLQINTPIPESEYILLSGKGIKDLPGKKYYGAKVVIKGVVAQRKSKEIELMKSKYGGPVGLEMICPDLPQITKPPLESLLVPEYYNICKKIPDFCKPPHHIFKEKYALLLSGGNNSGGAYSRYWNDLKFMYHTLHNKYGYSDENIVVVYKDGSAEDADMTVDYAASTTGVADAFAFLKARLSKRDTFVIFVTNHGGGYSMDLAVPGLYGGELDTSGDETDEAIFESHIGADLNGDGDQVDQIRYDEVTFLYNATPELTDDAFGDYVNDLKYGKMIIILEPCYSGGNLADLRGKNRVIVSAASEYEWSWGGGPGNHDVFSYYFTSALAGQTHDGTTVNADTSGDGKVSILEAFIYAQANDTKPETPFYEDNGDGRGHTGPFPVDGDGVWGATVTLD